MDHKAPEAFRTISEVADELDLPQHVLRFWETRFRDIRPMKRGGGRRYYRPDDIDLLRGVRHLLYGEGYTIRGVQRILAEQGVKFVQAVWQTGAPQPPHRAGAQDDDAGDEEIDVAEDNDSDNDSDDDSAGEAPRRGLRDRITSLIGRDLNETGEPVRREPPMRSAPLPQVAPVDRFVPVVAEPDEDASSSAASPRPAAAPPPVAAAGLPREDLRKLQAALHELGECRKLLAGSGSR